VEACPKNLAPQKIHELITHEPDDPSILRRLNGCVYCGVCSFACPARLPLAETFASFVELSAEKGRQHA
jgi:electron transport complex protein RnfC